MHRLKIRLALLSVSALFAASALAQTPPEPGSSPGVVLTNISKNAGKFVSAIPTVAVSPSNDELVSVAWRRYSLPIDTNALKSVRTADCHVTVSHDGGKSFKDTNLMPLLRNAGGNGEPSMWYCNLPWTTIAADGTLYAGGSTFTAGGIIQTEPKQGRAQAAVSTDGGKSWSKGVWAVSLQHVGPGVKGLQGGMEPQDTPWDGSQGFADAATGTMYVVSGGIVASTDKGKTYGNLYYAAAPGFTGNGRNLAASHGLVGASATVTAAPGCTKTPCLAFLLSKDNGATFAGTVVAQADGFSATGRTHYPEIAADPAHEGHFAIVTFTPDRRAVQVYFTEDSGATWTIAKVKEVPKDVLPVFNADQPGVGYTADGRILVAWRGFRSAGAYNVFAAVMDGKTFGTTIKLNPLPSIYPTQVQLGNYSFGGGDFFTTIAGNRTNAYVAFPYAPNGISEDTWLARVPLAMMK